MNMDGIFTAIKKLLGQDASGHGLDHVERVYRLSLQFADQENANRDIVALAALLHDVDDYKIFGQDSADNLTNATHILDEFNVAVDTKSHVLEIIKTMGYNRSLEGIRPATLEGRIVSDADMCDAIGAQGILRTHSYSASKGTVFFDPAVMPQNNELSASEYRTATSQHSVQHFFDKLLRIPSLLMTESGQAEGEKRKKIMTDFLEELFREEDAKAWLLYLKEHGNDSY